MGTTASTEHELEDVLSESIIKPGYHDVSTSSLSRSELLSDDEQGTTDSEVKGEDTDYRTAPEDKSGAVDHDPKDLSLSKWEELNEKVVVLLDYKQTEKAWLEELKSLKHIKEGIRKIHLKCIKIQRKNKQFRQIQEGEKEKPEVTVHVLVNSLLELKIFAGDKNKTLAHVVNTAYNHNAIWFMADALLKRGADPNAEPGADGKYALHWATVRQDTKLVERLLLGRADVSKVDDVLGESPLFLAIRNGQRGIKVFNMLLEKALNGLQIKRNDGRTLLQQAVIYNNNEAVTKLLAIDWTQKDYHLLVDQDGKSPLHWAVLQENVEIVKNLLSASQVPHPSLNEGDAAGNTPLHYSVMYGKKKVFKFLMSDDLASGLNIDKANHVGRTPLHLAFAAANYFGQERAGISDKEESNGSQETYFAQDLFSGKLKANISKRDKFGRTPLHEAAYWGKGLPFLQQLDDELDKAGLPIYKPADWIDEDGQTPHHDLLMHGYKFIDSSEDLLEWINVIDSFMVSHSKYDDPQIVFEEPICQKDKLGRIPIFLALKNGLDYVAEFFVSEGYVPLDKTTDNVHDGQTLLHVAAASPYTSDSMVEMLLDQGIDANTSDEFGRTALDVARSQEKQNDNIIKLLKDKTKVSTKPAKSQKSQCFKKYKVLLEYKNFDSMKQWLEELETFTKSKGTQTNEEDPAEMVKAVCGYDHFKGLSAEISDQQAYEVVKMVDAFLKESFIGGEKHKALAILFGIAKCPYDISCPYLVMCMTAELMSRGADPLKAQEECDADLSLLHKVVAMKGDSDCIWLMKQLLQRGTFIDKQDYMNGKTPLMTCCADGHTNHEAMVILLEHGADVSLVYDEDLEETALHLTARYGGIEDMRLLLLKGADPNVRNKSDVTALHLAGVSMEFLKKVDLLLQYGLNLNKAEWNKTYSKRGWTILHYATYYDRKETIKYICDHRPELKNVQDARGRTALHIATAKHKTDLASLLLEKGLDHELTDESGHTALDVFLANFDIASDSLWKSVWETSVYTMEEVAMKVTLRSTNELNKQLQKALNVFSGSTQIHDGVDQDIKELEYYLEKKSSDCNAVKTKIDKMPMLRFVAIVTGSTSGLRLENFLSDEQKDLTEAALGKFVVGNRVVNCEALDIESPRYDFHKKGTNQEVDKDGHGFCYTLLVLLVCILKIPLNFLRACTKPFDRQSRLEDDHETSERISLYHLASLHKTVASHPAVQTLLDYKWNFAFGHHSKLFLFYLIRMVILTLALLIAAIPDHFNPGCYLDNWDWARLAFEILSLLYFLWKLLDVLGDIRYEKTKLYFKDHLNWLQIPAILIPVLFVVPLRAATTWCASTGIDYCSRPSSNNVNVTINIVCIYASTQQWVFACLTYFFNAMLIFEFMAVYKFTGVYLFGLVEILKKDISRFLVFFVLVLYVFVGSFYLALRSGIVIEDNGNVRPDQRLHPLDTLYPWHSVFLGIRTVVEGGGLLDDYFATDSTGTYIGFSWLPMIVYLSFLFFVIVVLINVLIAQISKTYEDTTEEVNTKYYQALARHLKRYRQDTEKKFPYRQYLIINKERIEALKESHEKKLAKESFDSKKQREFKEDLLEKLKSELARELKDFLKGELSSVKDEVGKHNSISHTPLSSPACWQKEDHRIGIIKEDPGTPINTEDMQDPS